MMGFFGVIVGIFVLWAGTTIVADYTMKYVCQRCGKVVAWWFNYCDACEGRIEPVDVD